MKPPTLVKGQRIRFLFRGAWHPGTVHIASPNCQSIAIAPDDVVHLAAIGFDTGSGEQVILLLWANGQYLDIASKQTFSVEPLHSAN